MTEHPILFSAPMIRAILDSRKTQTRRIVKPQPKGGANDWTWDAEPGDVAIYRGWPTRFVESRGRNKRAAGELTPQALKCPYGKAGGAIWVRETFFAYGRWETRFSVEKARDEWYFVDMTLECGHEYDYVADGHSFAPHRRAAGVTSCWWKRPAIFMPRHASRITLRITDVRVERLQDITEDDAAAEGCSTIVELDGSVTCGRRKSEFRDLWDSLNAKRGAGWDTNPWVWRIEFERVEPKND